MKKVKPDKIKNKEAEKITKKQRSGKKWEWIDIFFYTAIITGIILYIIIETLELLKQ